MLTPRTDHLASETGFSKSLFATRTPRTSLWFELNWTDCSTRGGIALLLDALDETYDRRGKVVSEIDAFRDSIHQDVDVLLATRDVAYGQAATLRWDHVRLCRPASVAKTIASILRRSAPALGADKWVAERREWVDHALIGDATLCETPLL